MQVNSKIRVITTDGRVFEGFLALDEPQCLAMWLSTKDRGVASQVVIDRSVINVVEDAWFPQDEVT